jgi:nickel-dependent lactate racemase
MNVALRYGKDWLTGDLPEEWHVDVLSPAGAPPVADAAEAIADALDHPLGSACLSHKARGADAALVVVSDITRPVPNALVLPPLLARLKNAGVRPSQVTILVGTGLHRPPTDEEVVEIVGAEALAAGVKVEAHHAKERGEHMHRGETSRGVPVWIDRRYIETPLRIAIGLVEPHLMAGFSGGPKSLCPGIAGEETIMAFHGPRLLAHPRAMAGVTEGNPVYEEAWDVASMAGLPDFCINFVLSLQREIVGVHAGAIAAVHEAAIAQARAALGVTIDAPADVVVTSAGGYPLDLTFYQGTKGIVAASDIVRQGGGIVVVERNAEGVGNPEIRDLLASCGDPAQWRPDLDADSAAIVDEWQLQELAKAACKARVVNVCPDAPAELRKALPVPTVDRIEDALELLASEGIPGDGPVRAAVMPDGPYTLAEVAAKA